MNLLIIESVSDGYKRVKKARIVSVSLKSRVCGLCLLASYCSFYNAYYCSSGLSSRSAKRSISLISVTLQWVSCWRGTKFIAEPKASALFQFSHSFSERHS